LLFENYFHTSFRSPKSNKKSRKKKDRSSSSSSSDDEKSFNKDLLEKLEKERQRSFLERKTYKEQVSVCYYDYDQNYFKHC